MRIQQPPPSPLREWPYPGEVVQVAFSDNAQRIAFGGEPGSIELWERTGEHLFTYISPDGELPPFALSPDGTKLAVAGPDRQEIQAYLVESGQHIASFTGTRGKATCIAFSPHGDITSGSNDGWVYVWDWGKSHEEYAFKTAYKANPDERDGRPIRAIAWSPDGELLTTIEEGDTFINMYRYAKQNRKKQIGSQADGQTAQAVSWRADGKQLAVAYGTRIEIQGRQQRKAPLVTCVGHAEKVAAICWSHDERFVLSLSQSGELHAWNAETGQLVGSLSAEGDDTMRSIAVGAGGLVLVGCRDWMVRLYDALVTVGYRVSGEESRELTSPLEWSFVQCTRCLYGEDLTEYQSEAQVKNIARIEAADAVCSTCHICLATGKPMPTGHSLKDFFSIDLGGLLEELDVEGWAEGGCWVAAQGLLGWMETSAEPPQARLMIVEAEPQGSAFCMADHVVIELVVAGSSLCLDAEGVAKSGDFLNAWAHAYRRGRCALVPLDEQYLHSLAYRCNPEMSDRIADALHERFGEFQLTLLPQFARKNEE